MRITTFNVNGLRAVLQKGLPEALDRLGTDVLLLQEVRATPEQLPAPWAAPPGWHVLWNPAQKLGYAGTAIWSRRPLEPMPAGFDDPDGRITRAKVGAVEVISVYLPSGSSSPERQLAKEAWMARFQPWAAGLAQAPHPVVLGGDLNIAHTERDIHEPKRNAKNSGFLPHERAWFGELLATGWTDAVRAHLGPQQGPYSWWSNRGQARALDRGWRIDYLLGNRAAQPYLGPTVTWRELSLSLSDHAPVSVDLTE
jgi:exodeoxyribonuclease-3